MSKYCPNCGEELVDNAKFCKSCGTNLKNNQTPQKKDQFTVPQVEKDYTIHIILGYALTIFLPILGLIISIYLLTRSAEKAKKHGKYMIILFIIIFMISLLRIW